MEILDIYNKYRVKTGETHERWRKQPAGDYRLVVFIAVFNGAGQMLIQQRHPLNLGWSGFWDITAGGAAASGDTSQQAAGRELFEEVGIKVDFSDATPHFTINTDRTFCDFYLHQKDVDIDSLQLGYDEVAQVKWAAKEEILSMVEDGSFVPFQEGVIELCFSLIKRRRTLRYDL
jgi:isopentenyldiphosphate isomerase